MIDSLPELHAELPLNLWKTFYPDFGPIQINITKFPR